MGDDGHNDPHGKAKVKTIYMKALVASPLLRNCRIVMQSIGMDNLPSENIDQGRNVIRRDPQKTFLLQEPKQFESFAS